MPITTLVDTARLRWRIERDFQDLKQEIGLDHPEGRGQGGFHCHAALKASACGFWVPDKEFASPSAPITRALAATIPLRQAGFKPRGHAAQA